jgi:cholesterol oxidase
MRGHVGFGATDYAAGEKLGKDKGTTFVHEVLIQMKDIDVFVSEPTHTAPMDGHVEWLGDSRPFRGGEFNMLVDSNNPKVKHMFYRIPFDDKAGKPMTMLGYKRLRDDPGLDLWEDITTLFIQIYEGHEPGRDFTKPPSGPTPEWPPGDVARGIIHITLRDGFHSAMSFDAPGATKQEKLGAVKKFLAFYGDRVVDLYVKQTKRTSLIAIGVSVVFLAVLIAMAAR